MTKQSEIREHLVEFFEQTDFSKETPGQLADAILWVLNEDGVVIKVESAKPPIFFGKEITISSKQLATIVEKVRDTYDMAGYVAVEPLIEVKENEV